jgi:hypothetical protein
MTLHAAVYKAEFVVKTCNTVCFARFQVFALLYLRSLFIRVVMVHNNPEERRLQFVLFLPCARQNRTVFEGEI